ncbi:fructose-1,6-bisphosphatase/inositol monophosphatase family enzyme [Sphingomonas sp. BE270]|jgi:fructose-1,6-bisphosphatase/inositol monophosphatase family enzyme|uniref:inositol monophosphatase family protein n=1 Tax=unclassified Sphingomonas TaxID=196159 RepID=UPI000F86F4BC|nr:MULTISPECIES: inositol monophosphatase [unclassified Sphingomonas]MDR7256207.1 fructose-1,6-bisphosphatase/inositol monophosphatase family enzyme [Sphingomonas sp. BE270]RUN75399.1 inositol monophosphatase [Sphingomonas sp. TF3]
MALREQVSALLREVAQAVVMPCFRALAPHDIEEKRPGEIVTRADREAELRLRDGLEALGLGARIVGEEAVEDAPELLDNIGTGLVWLIDPLDGTANFARGEAPFGLMIALVENGVPLAGWMLDPLRDRLCHAERGRGATCDGARVRTTPSGRARPIAALGTQFLAPVQRARVQASASRRFDLTPIPRCAAESYPRVAFGQNDITLFQRILPWDHAAGAVFLTEAGGEIRHWDHRPYRVGSNSAGVLAAATPALWDSASALLLGVGSALADAEGIAA